MMATFGSFFGICAIDQALFRVVTPPVRFTMFRPLIFTIKYFGVLFISLDSFTSLQIFKRLHEQRSINVLQRNGGQIQFHLFRL
jgi:hypothetical protein